ncbi:MAG: hypothetical protein L3J75_06770 [Methylococcaceae bacterium]|nr:hypothetical protein [Methylococcaceae bacterium]
MCSSPKGSTTRRRHVKKSEFSRSEYEEYARMVRKASAVYDRIEQEKVEKTQVSASQQSTITSNKKDVLKNEDRVLVTVFSGIKAFLLRPVF